MPPLPNPLPQRFTAALNARVRALLAHSVLDDGRQQVAAPTEGDLLPVRVRVDREDGTLRLIEFPEVEDEVATAIGAVRAVVSVDDEPGGTYEDATGHVRIEVPVHVDVKSMLARDSDVRVTLTTDGAIDQPELQAAGDPLDAGDSTVRLVGQGTFEGGSLDGGTMWLVVDCEIQSVDAEAS